MSTNKIYDVLIIGAGMTGISAGKYLASEGVEIKILDKGRATGGRIATKRIEFEDKVVTFDYGCKYFVAEGKEFLSELNSLFSKNIVKYWNVNQFHPELSITDESIKIVGKISIRNVALELSKKLDISNNTLVKKIEWNEGHWKILTDNDLKFYSSCLLLTMPLPQMIDLFNSSFLDLPEDIMSILEKVEYERNIEGLLILESESRLKDEGGLNFQHGEISFITDNNLKGINNYKTAISVEMSHEFSLKNWHLNDEEIFEKMSEITQDILGSKIIDYKIHRWKYSKPSNSYIKTYESLVYPGPLFMAGDVFLGSSVESAYISGLNAAKSIKNILISEEKADAK